MLPSELTRAIMALPGVRVGRRITQAPSLPAFVLDDACPVAVVREFLGGLFGADGHAPDAASLGRRARMTRRLSTPAYSQSALPEHVDALKQVMGDIVRLLARCGVETDGAKIYEYPTRRSASTYPAAQDGVARTEVRLALPDGLSFVERVGYRYCVDKAMRASAAAVYWRTIRRHPPAAALDVGPPRRNCMRRSASCPSRRCARWRRRELLEREPAVSPHYSLLEGHDRFTRLPQATARTFQPLHRDSCDFPSPVELLHASLACASGSRRYSHAGEAGAASATASRKKR